MYCRGTCWGGCSVHKICSILLLVGGLNWGLTGVGMLAGSNWNVIDLLLGENWPGVEAIIYLVIGVAALVGIFGCKCKKCLAACAACVSDSGKMGSGMEGKM